MCTDTHRNDDWLIYFDEKPAHTHKVKGLLWGQHHSYLYETGHTGFWLVSFLLSTRSMLVFFLSSVVSMSCRFHSYRLLFCVVCSIQLVYCCCVQMLFKIVAVLSVHVCTPKIPLRRKTESLFSPLWLLKNRRCIRKLFAFFSRSLVNGSILLQQFLSGRSL